MGGGRGKNTFTNNLQKDFPFLKKTDKTTHVNCKLCVSEFSIANGGRSDINKHVKSIKHKTALLGTVKTQVITSHFSKKILGNDEKLLAAREGLFAYHTVLHSQSFRSMDCTSTIIKKLYEKQFGCSRTKSQAIVENVFSPFAMKKLTEELEQSNFVCLYYDGSNHKDIKMMPIMIRYFLPHQGISVKILQFSDLPGETAELISEYLCKEIGNSSLKDKIIAICADNTNTNFGGQKRKGKKNVLKKMNEKLEKKLVGVGCSAHIVHNAIKTAADCLPIDLESIVVKIYGYFYIYTVRVSELKEFCDFCESEYSQILGYSKTRFLALRPALERIIKMFQPLKSYFLSIDKCPVVLLKFFNDPCAELWLHFLHTQAEMFYVTIKRIEGEKNGIVQVSQCLRELKDKLSNRINDNYLPGMMKNMLEKLVENGEATHNNIIVTAVDFYQTCLTYLNDWTSEFEPYEKLTWMDLHFVLPDWTSIQNSTQEIISKIQEEGKAINESELYDEINFIREVVTSSQIRDWKEREVHSDKRWVEIFTKLSSVSIPLTNIKIIAEFVFTLPGTNAVTERLFSIVNKIWTTEKTRLSMKTLKAMLITRLNIGMDCLEFYDVLSNDSNLLAKIHSSAKYNLKSNP